jgi:hypothetical protein
MVNPTPDNVNVLTSRSEAKKSILTASPDIIKFNDNFIEENAEIFAQLLFENIGGQELLSIARYDTVNGQSVAYQPIKNLAIIQQEYNPLNILRLQQTSDKIFANFPIKLDIKIPNVGNGPNGENVYLDDNGSIVLEFVNLEADEQIEVQIAASGTIYEAGI